MSYKYDFVIIPLLILIILTFISIISGNDFVSYAVSKSFSFSQTIDDATSQVNIPTMTTDFSLSDPLLQAIIWISVIAVAAIASSITIVSTGLSSSGQRWIVGLIFFVSLWTMFSTLPYNLIVASGQVGLWLYFGLTLFYAIGAIWILMEGGGE